MIWIAAGVAIVIQVPRLMFDLYWTTTLYYTMKSLQVSYLTFTLLGKQGFDIEIHDWVEFKDILVNTYLARPVPKIP